MKKILGTCLIAAALGCSVAAASPLVTADVPLDSNYYLYLDKMEGMGYITSLRVRSRIAVWIWRSGCYRPKL